MAKLELEFLHAELNRVTGFVSNAEKKGGFIGVYYTSIIAFIYSQKNIWIDKLNKLFESNDNLIVVVLLFLMILIFAIGLYILYLAIFPNYGTKNKNNSLFFFGDISKLGYKKYSKNILNISKKNAKKQIVEQIYENAEIAHKKMVKIKSSMILLYILGLLTIVFAYFINK